MENPGSSIISALGAGSGVNFIQLADDLSDATYAVQRQNLTSRNEALEARISAAALLRSTLTGLASALGDRVRNGDLAPTAQIANPTVARVSTSVGTNPIGSYSLEVSQLAQSQTLVLQPFASGDDLVGEGTLRIRFGTVDEASFGEDAGSTPLEIAVTAEDTLATLASKITSSSGGAVSAYVAQGSNGAQLVFKGESGAASGFTIEGESAAASPTGAAGDLSYLSWQPASDSGELRQTAVDARFAFDTVERTSASNTITGLPGGMTLELTGTNVGAATSITFTNNQSAITSVMGDFVAALNDLTSLVNESAAAQGGALGNDPAARQLKRDLASLTSQIVMPGAEEGEPSTLADLGLSFNRDGTFRLDEARLQETLLASPEGAAAMFTNGPFGVFATMDRLARQNTLTGNPGSLGGSIARYTAQIERNDERLSGVAEQQERLRDRLSRNLIAAETRIASSQSTLTFLQQQIDAWNTNN